MPFKHLRVTGNMTTCGVVINDVATQRGNTLVDWYSEVTCSHCLDAIAHAPGNPVNRPTHYTAGKVECIDAIEAATHNLGGVDGFLTGQVIKYVWRWKLKNGLEDLEKAKWYLQRLIDRVKGGIS